MRRTIRLAAALAAFASLGSGAQSLDGRALFARADKGNCIACHRVPEGFGPVTRANVGPALDAERLKGWDAARLRALLQDPMATNAETLMPPYGRHRLLDAAEIDRIVEFLRALP